MQAEVTRTQKDSGDGAHRRQACATSHERAANLRGCLAGGEVVELCARELVERVHYGSVPVGKLLPLDRWSLEFERLKPVRWQIMRKLGSELALLEDKLLLVLHIRHTLV